MSDDSPDRPNTPFPVTRWTLVRKVQSGGDAEAAQALEQFCAAYWYPIYAFARRYGFAVHDAEDLTQIFFQNLITHESIHAAQQEKGQLRTFMLAVLKRIIGKKLRYDAAAMRSKSATISFDDESAEERYSHEPADIKDPDTLFDRAWAEGVLHAAEAKLRADYERGDDVETYDLLREFLPLGDNATPYAQVAARSQNTEATVRLQIHRMRKRYAKLIEAEIAETVESPEELKAEIAHLMAAIGR